jgi:hypothetical protein
LQKNEHRLSKKADVFFYETQSLRSLWFAVLVYPGTATMIALFGFAMHRQLGRGIPFGQNPMPDSLLWILGPFMILLGVFLLTLFHLMRLETSVRRDGLHIRYVPIVDRLIGYDTIEDIRACVYRPIRDYGGWGIRRGKRGRAYNVRGNRGVELRFTDGSTLMIGSQRADELASAIKGMKGGCAIS